MIMIHPTRTSQATMVPAMVPVIVLVRANMLASVTRRVASLENLTARNVKRLALRNRRKARRRTILLLLQVQVGATTL
jgi:hypothetical protein